MAGRPLSAFEAAAEFAHAPSRDRQHRGRPTAALKQNGSEPIGDLTVRSAPPRTSTSDDLFGADEARPLAAVLLETADGIDRLRTD